MPLFDLRSAFILSNSLSMISFVILIIEIPRRADIIFMRLCDSGYMCNILRGSKLSSFIGQVPFSFAFCLYQDYIISYVNFGGHAVLEKNLFVILGCRLNGKFIQLVKINRKVFCVVSIFNKVFGVHNKPVVNGDRF